MLFPGGYTMASPQQIAAAETKRVFDLRFQFLKTASSSTNVSAIAAETLKWLADATKRWNEAPLKRGDVDALIARCKAAGSFGEAIRLVGSVFSDPSKLGKCFPLPIADLVNGVLEDND